jgi:hypothetical protein
MLYHTKYHNPKVDISKKLENESGVKLVLKPTEEMDDDEKDI